MKSTSGTNGFVRKGKDIEVTVTVFCSLLGGAQLLRDLKYGAQMVRETTKGASPNYATIFSVCTGRCI